MRSGPGPAIGRPRMWKAPELGRMKPPEMLAALSRLTATDQLALFADRDVVVEAVIENEEAKTKLYRELQPILKPDVILASNTSTISITRMAKAWPKPRSPSGMSSRATM